ncbi:hypothetical protein JCM6882_005787 [Rhodosporidiobolus microsporus]
MAPLLPGFVELPSAAFAKLKFESIGSPAPWTTAAVLPPTSPMRHRVLLAALVSLSRALADSSEQGAILALALERARAALEKQRGVVGEVKREVLEAAREAQRAHKECRRVEGALSGRFRDGADKVVARLDERVVSALRKGKSVEADDPFSFVEELVVSLGLDPASVRSSFDASAVELDADWQAIANDVVATMAARAAEKKSPRQPLSSFRLPGEGDRPPSLPPTPPASVHSSDPGHDDDDDEGASEDDLVAVLTPLVHPVLLLLYHLHHTLSTCLTSSLASFESLVARSAAAVEAHRLAAQKAARAAGKLRDLEELEVREREEEGRVVEELRGTVVELARVALGREEEEEEAEEEEAGEEGENEKEEDDDG